MIKRSFVLTVLMLFSASVFAHGKDKELDERVARLERMADNPILMTLSRRLGEQQREIQDLQDKIDRLNHQLDKLAGRLDDRYKETDDRLSKLEAEDSKAGMVMVGNVSSAQTAQSNTTGSETVTQSKVSEASSTSSVTPIKVHAATEEEKKTYQQAFSLMKQSQYKLAIEAFNQFAHTYSESSLASNAYYWAGEAHMVLEQKSAGLVAFKKVTELYPNSSKAPAAMLRYADTLESTGNVAQAKQAYQQLMDQYPKSRVAGKAKKRFEALK